MVPITNIVLINQLSPLSGRCGLWIDENLLHGSSSPCDTFGNETLSSSPEFVIVGLEAWMLL